MADEVLTSQVISQVAAQDNRQLVGQVLAQVATADNRIEISQLMVQVAYSDEVTFVSIELGVNGGLREDNLSSYLLAPKLLRHGTWFGQGVKQRMWWGGKS